MRFLLSLNVIHRQFPGISGSGQQQRWVGLYNPVLSTCATSASCDGIVYWASGQPFDKDEATNLKATNFNAGQFTARYTWYTNSGNTNHNDIQDKEGTPNRVFGRICEFICPA